MPEMRLSDQMRALLLQAQGKEVDYAYLRTELRIDPTSPAWDGIRKQMALFVVEGLVKPSGRKDGIYKVIKQIKPVTVFGRERRPLANITFPRDHNTFEELCFAQDIVFREGDLILISGRSNYGKTTMCLNLCAENIDAHPVLMGNEYTTLDNEPSPRFLDRLDKMDWVGWFTEAGEDNFTLLPVRDDYAEHIVRNKLNIIDWINLEEHYLISKIMEDIKRSLGNGIGIIAIQKSEGAEAGRGGQFTRDFADVEILLDQYGEHEVLMGLGKVKESRRKVSGKHFAFAIEDGVKIVNFREVKQCYNCFGKGWKGINPCPVCEKRGYLSIE